MRPSNEYIADVRYSATHPANSAAAAAGAIRTTGLTKVFMHCIYGAHEDDSALFFVPPLDETYLLLRTMKWDDWFFLYYIERRIPQPDILQEIQCIAEVEQFWVHLDVAPEFQAAAIELFAHEIDDDQRFVLVSPGPLPSVSGTEHLKFCTPDPKADFYFAGDNSAGITRANWARSFSVGVRSRGRYRGVAVP